ncbi:MAG TPA: carboxylating nicotinate-nucleotide diphosphorylase [Desulfobulbus sp.]|nr:carboxylating nicotinate-nucleotide diphosphorylase [Desulfobulbus sp.]
MDGFLLDEQLRRFLEEDLEHGDITTDALFGQETASARFVAREPLVACGMEQVAARVFCLLGGPLEFGQLAADGSRKKTGQVLLTAQGPVRTLLRGERVALNLVQRLCAIATRTKAFVDQVQGLPVRIVDTRKTTPGLRMLEKYAVRCGGGGNHRYGLSDGVLVKDNHIAASGSIAEAVERLRRHIPHTLKIEVECDSPAQVEECLDCGVEIIMLDNMDTATMAEAVRHINGRALVEASGGVRLETVRAIAETGVDIISVGGLTHSAPGVDIGMDWN